MKPAAQRGGWAVRLLPSLLLGLLLSPAVTQAQAASAASGFHVRPVDDAWRAALPRVPVAATQADMERLPADVVLRSTAYFEGRNWLQRRVADVASLPLLAALSSTYLLVATPAP